MSTIVVSAVNKGKGCLTMGRLNGHIKYMEELQRVMDELVATGRDQLMGTEGKSTKKAQK